MYNWGYYNCTFGFIFVFYSNIYCLSKEHNNRIAILLMNIFFGLTGIGWLILFIWACSSTNNHIRIGQTPTIAQEIKELAELKKKGIITEEEFNNTKTQLLNSDANTMELE